MAKSTGLSDVARGAVEQVAAALAVAIVTKLWHALTDDDDDADDD